jgi:broad specificity phosphatase PhoE
MNIFLVRHGQSEDASGGLHQRDESPLSEKGVGQAQQLGERFKNIQIDTVIASPVPRAKQTAEIIAKAISKEIIEDALFVERVWPTQFRSGTRKDVPKYEEEARYIQRMMNVDYLDPNARHSDEETIFGLQERATSALAKLATLEEENILVATHSAFIRMLTLVVALENQAIPQAFFASLGTMSMGNVGITVLKYEAASPYVKWKLISWNDVSHLG